MLEEFSTQYCWYREGCERKDNPETCNITSCVEYRTMYNVIKKANLPQVKWSLQKMSVQQVDLDAFKQLEFIKSNIIDFVSSGANLYLHSLTTGNGKTTWAIRLLQTYLSKMRMNDAGKPMAVFINIPMFLIQNKQAFNHPTDEFYNLFEAIEYAHLVVWDDIAISELKQYDYSVLIALINARELAERANVYTGNLPPEKLKGALGERLSDRVLSTSTIIELKGLGYRDIKGCTV